MENIYVNDGFNNYASEIEVSSVHKKADVHVPLTENPKYVALFDFDPREHGDLGFRKGDTLTILNDSGDWWLAYNHGQSDRGYVPCNYIQPINSLGAEEWFFEHASKSDAENFLLAPALKPGAFMVRGSDSETGAYSLSMRDSEGGITIKHYRIRTSEADGKYYLVKKRRFSTVPKLIKFYKDNDQDLPRRLGKACPRETPATRSLGRSVWEIDRDSLKWERKLGEGSFGEVWKALWKDRVPVAVKSLRQSSMSTESFLEEARIMKGLRHNNLVPLYGVCSSQEPIYILTEFMRKGSLLDYLRKGDGKDLLPKGLTDIGAQVASGMSYLEKKNFIHRDLAARNVLVGENNMVKVADFGLARVVSNQIHQTKEDSPFPIRWTAPEAILRAEFSIRSDVWSFGVLLFELFSKGEVPYAGFSASEILPQLQKGYRLPKPRTCSGRIYKTMTTCWSDDPEMRPSFQYLDQLLEQHMELQND